MPPAEPPPGGSRRYVVTSHRRPAPAQFLDDWRALHAAHPSRGPLCEPDVQLTWCEQFVPAGDERLLAVRHEPDGTLVAVLPLFLHRTAGRLPWGTSVHVIGAFHEPMLHELPEVLLDPAHARPALAAAIDWLYRHDRWDWIDLDLRDDQPWPEPRWTSDAGVQPVILLRDDLPSIRLGLPPASEPLPVSRNLRESLRRFRNRVRKLDGDVRMTRSCPADPAWPIALNDLITLHRARSGLDGRPQHADIFAGTSQEAFLRRFTTAMRASRPVVHRLLRDGEPLAALLALESPQAVWIGISGMTPQAWELSAITGLQEAAINAARCGGATRAYFSTGVDTAKLRWSTDIVLTHRFVFVHPRPSSRRLVRLAVLARAHRHLTRELRRFTPGKTPGPTR